MLDDSEEDAVQGEHHTRLLKDCLDERSLRFQLLVADIRELREGEASRGEELLKKMSSFNEGRNRRTVGLSEISPTSGYGFGPRLMTRKK